MAGETNWELLPITTYWKRYFPFEFQTDVFMEPPTRTHNSKDLLPEYLEDVIILSRTVSATQEPLVVKRNE